MADPELKIAVQIFRPDGEYSAAEDNTDVTFVHSFYIAIIRLCHCLSYQYIRSNYGSTPSVALSTVLYKELIVINCLFRTTEKHEGPVTYKFLKLVIYETNVTKT